MATKHYYAIRKPERRWHYYAIRKDRSLTLAGSFADPIEMDIRHAPKGGITIAGVTYPGGEYLPDEALEALARERQEGKAPPVPAQAEKGNVAIDEHYMHRRMPMLDEMIEEAIAGREMATVTISSWDDLDDSDKEHAESQWIESNLDGFYDNAHESWLEDLTSTIRDQLDNDGEWDENLFKEWAGGKGFTEESIDNSFSPGRYSQPPRIDFEDLVREDGKAIDGDEATDLENEWNDHYSTERDQEFERRLEAESDDVPDSVRDSALDEAIQAWNELSDSDKFEQAGGEREEHIRLREPDEYKVIKDGGDYERTRGIALYIQSKRAAQLMEKRGLERISPDVISSHLWSAWKSSSKSDWGLLLQQAAAEELNGHMRFPEKINGTETSKRLEGAIRQAKHDAGSAFTMAHLRAYVRATWEASQYVMRKAGIKDMTVWRGVMISKRLVEQEQQHEIETKTTWGDPAKYKQLPGIKLLRNGCASTTSDPGTANAWGGAGVEDQDSTRVVLRIQAPRTAVLSLPCFGQNVHDEQEVVLAGNYWRSWDAWLDRAPSTPIGKATT